MDNYVESDGWYLFKIMPFDFVVTKIYWILIKGSDIVKKTSHFQINSLRLSDACMRQYKILALLQIMACRLFGAKPLSEPMLLYC